MSFKITNKIVFIFVLIAFAMSSCIFVKYNNSDDRQPEMDLSPKPEIQMSDVIIRSAQGDMISFIPQDWFLIDVEERAASGLIAVAVNPDYSLSAVFSLIRSNNIMDKTIEKEGLFGLARMNLERHKRKTAGDIKLIGQYQPFSIGNKHFVKYKISTTGGALSSDIIVFMTETGNYYEFALMPMDVIGKPLPSRQDMDRIFDSIVASIQFN